MAEKQINQLPVSSGLTDDGLLVVYQNNETQSIEGRLIRKFVEETVDGSLSKKANVDSPVFTESISLGREIDTTVGRNSVALGSYCEASGNYSFAAGSNTTASNGCSHAIGFQTTASAYGASAEGQMTNATGTSSHAEGSYTTASGYESHAEGSCTTAGGEASHAEGHYTTASGKYSHAEGNYTTAGGQAQHVQGRYNVADSSLAHIVGNGYKNNPSNAHTLGWNGVAWFANDVYVGSTSGTNKDEGSKKLLKEGDVTVPTKTSELTNDSGFITADDVTVPTKTSELMNDSGFITADDVGNLDLSSKADADSPVFTSAVSMYRTPDTTVGFGSVALGTNTTATGRSSGAFGMNTIAYGDSQHVCGKNNIPDATSLHIVGNGTASVQSNAHTLDGNGTAWFAGDVYVGSTSGTNKDVGSKKLLKEGDVTVPTKTSELTNDSGFITSDHDHEISDVTGLQTALDAKAPLTAANDLLNALNGKAPKDHLHDIADVTNLQTALDGKANTNAPVFTGSISIGRKADTTVGAASVALGASCEASGLCSFAVGLRTTARAQSSNAEGIDTTASGYASHSEGAGTTASGQYQHVQGKYNIPDTTSLHIVGNGDSDTPSNAHTLGRSGNAWFAGDVYVGSTSGTNKDDGSKKLATEEYVDNAVAGGGSGGVTSVNGETGAVQLDASDIGLKIEAWTITYEDGSTRALEVYVK